MHADPFQFDKLVGTLEAVDSVKRVEIASEITTEPQSDTLIDIFVIDQSNPQHTIFCGVDAAGEIYYTNQSWSWFAPPAGDKPVCADGMDATGQHHEANHGHSDHRDSRCDIAEQSALKPHQGGNDRARTLRIGSRGSRSAAQNQGRRRGRGRYSLVSSGRNQRNATHDRRHIVLGFGDSRDASGTSNTSGTGVVGCERLFHISVKLIK